MHLVIVARKEEGGANQDAPSNNVNGRLPPFLGSRHMCFHGIVQGHTIYLPVYKNILFIHISMHRSGQAWQPSLQDTIRRILR